jgi:hypothetical protein
MIIFEFLDYDKGYGLLGLFGSEQGYRGNPETSGYRPRLLQPSQGFLGFPAVSFLCEVESSARHLLHLILSMGHI